MRNEARDYCTLAADHIAYHATERPNAAAIISDGRVVTYGEFCRDIPKFAAALHALGLRSGNSVAIGCDDFYVNCLLLLACERIGVATASLQTREAPSARTLLAQVDLDLSDQEYPRGAAKRQHTITPEWLRGVFGHAVPEQVPSPPKAADDIVRIGRTSGTTGDSKLLGFTRQQRDARVNGQVWGAELTRGSRCLVGLPLTVNSSYVLVMGAFQWGATVIAERRMDFVRAISAHAVSHIVMLPVHLRVMLDGLPADFQKPTTLTIISIGAPVTEALRERAMARLATRVCDLYGCQEVGNIAWRTMAGSGGIATVWPNVEVEVVDDADVPAPMGHAGRLRVRADYMVQRYLNDPEATRRMFRHGWFYPGDMAILHGAGRLQLVGRGDDLLNIGGFKIPPGEVEEVILKATDAKDTGVCSIRNAEGIEEIWIAVMDCALTDNELLPRLSHILRRLQFTTFHVIRLQQIPRTDNGKVQRDRLRAAMVEAAKRPPA